MIGKTPYIRILPMQFPAVRNRDLFLCYREINIRERIVKRPSHEAIIRGASEFGALARCTPPQNRLAQKAAVLRSTGESSSAVIRTTDLPHARPSFRRDAKRGAGLERALARCSAERRPRLIGRFPFARLCQA
jgi:hypothetical protein